MTSRPTTHTISQLLSRRTSTLDSGATPPRSALLGTLAVSGALMFGPALGLALQSPSNPKKAPIESSNPARAAFERLARLEGEWVGRSTKGWEEVISFKTIAQGSVVHEKSFDAHPNETMATMYYLDGSQLLLTHYCVSKTQPRLRAEAFEDGGRKVTFAFLDGGNLESRDQGHMDKMVMRFIDENHFSSQWTWYQDGKERWMEEVKYERKSPSRDPELR